MSHTRKSPNTLQEVAQKEVVSRRQLFRRLTLFRGVFLLGVLLFTILAVAAHAFAYFAIDLQVTRVIQTIDSPTAAWVLRSFSWIGFTPQSTLLVTVISLLLFLSGLRWEGILSVVAAVSVTGVNLILKSLINRPRPSADLVEVFARIPEYSFPSGHVMFYTVYFGYLIFLSFILMRHAWLRRSSITVCALLIMGVAPSRIFMGQHWASDTVGAYLAGAIWLAVIVQIYYFGRAHILAKRPVIEN